MDEQFVSDGLTANRYLKAQRLVKRFETEVSEVLDQACLELCERHPDLFENDVSLSRNRISGSTLRTIRTEVRMKLDDDEGNSLKWNIGLEWVTPDQQPGGSPNITDDTLCYVQYKIQRGSKQRFGEVKQATREDGGWEDVQFGDELWDTPPKVAPGIVYVPVAEGEDIADAVDRLLHHFDQIYAPLFVD